jgi:hypothetical protein
MLKYQKDSQGLFRNYFAVYESLEKSCGKAEIGVGLLMVVRA